MKIRYSTASTEWCIGLPDQVAIQSTLPGGTSETRTVLQNNASRLGFRGVEENPSPDGGSPRSAANSGPAVGYNADGPILPGMRSNSSLTLQPFAAPLVSVPPVYDLPQIASSLFGADSAATAEGPLVAGAATATGARP